MENQTHPQQKGLSDKLHDLFAPKKKNIEPIALQPTAQENPESRRTGETYEQWGTRICGIVSGSLTALPPNLQRVYNAIYNEQAQNVELQEAARANTQAEIQRKNGEISAIKQKKEDASSDIAEINKQIETLQAREHEIRVGKERVNKQQRLKLIIGLVIIIPLTFYLFIFYSSTFYSAFFRDPSNITDVMQAMFDSNALANAFAGGITEFGFVLSAPVIFLGLGFALHFFAVQKEKTKYLKMAAILLVTVMFDCILAYKIGEQLHSFGILTGQYPINEEYTAAMAFRDINTWAVIFCGFIVYVIWGIVFDMCMTAHDNMDLNKTELADIAKEIAAKQKKISDLTTNLRNLTTQENAAQTELQQLMAKLGHEVYIDFAAIRTEMTNFFAGWIKMMQVLSLGQDQQDEASEIFKSQVPMLIPRNKQTIQKCNDMKKNIITATILFSLLLTNLCTSCGGRAKNETAEQNPPLNISIYLDLSDRLVRDLTPNQTYRDTAITNYLVDYFRSKTLGPQILKSTNKLKVFFYPTPNDSEISTLARGLCVDMEAEKGIDKRKTLDSMKETFQKNLAQIYDETIKAKNWIGCDIWDFFSNKKVDNLCIKDGARNIIVILTDGYIYAANNQIKDGDAYSYILPQTLSIPNSSLIDRRKGELKGKGLEVLILEVNPYQPSQRDKMVKILEDWFTAMGIEKFVVAETDANLTNTQAIIKNFLDD